MDVNIFCDDVCYLTHSIIVVRSIYICFENRLCTLSFIHINVVVFKLFYFILISIVLLHVL